MIKKIIFDFDDTITDNQLLDYMAFAIPSKKLGISRPTKLEIKKARKRGLLAEDIISPYLKDQNSETKKRFFLFRRNFLNNIDSADFLRAQKNLKSLLDNVVERKINCVICSSKKNKKIIIKFLEENNLRKFFDEIFVSSDLCFEIDNRNKDNRILIKRSLLYSVIKKEKKKSGEVVFIGNFEDMIAAKKLDMISIYFQNSYLQKQHIKTTISANNMIQLNNIIKEIDDRK